MTRRLSFGSNSECAMSSTPVVWGPPDYEWAIGEDGQIKLGALTYLVTVIDQYSDGSLEVEVWVTGKTLTVKPQHLRLQPKKPKMTNRNYARG